MSMKIDIFNHFMPTAYLQRLAALIPGHVAVTAFPRLATLCDIDARLRLVERFGDLQNVLSLANPPLELVAGRDVTPELARIANDALALPRRDLQRLDGSDGVANEALSLLGVERSIGCKQGMSAAEERVPAAGRRALAVHRGIRM